MGGLESVFIPALSGYVYHRTSYKLRSQINRESGYHVLFRSAVIGIFSYPVAYLVTWFLFSHLPNYAATNFPFLAGWIPSGSIPTSFFPFLTGWISIGLCWCVASIKNRRSDKEEVEAGVAAEMGDFLSLLMRDCNKRDKMMEITLKNRKVYVGLPISSPGPRLSTDQFIRILPFMSGYRDEESLESHFNTYYEWVSEPGDDRYLKNVLNLDAGDFAVTIARKEIVSARIFDEEVYVRFITGKWQ